MTTTQPTLNDLLAEVSKELQRVEKKGKAPSVMGGFAFVRESDVVEALKPLLDARGIRLVPSIENTELNFYPRKDKDGPGVLATVTLAMHAVKGEEEALLFRTVGQGADTQDKAPAKAITAAKKQGFLIAFSIPTGDDPEAVSLDEAKGDEPVDKGVPTDAITQKQKNLIRAKAREAGVTDDQLAALRLAVTGKKSSAQMTNGDVDALLEVLKDPAKMAAALTGGEVVE